MKGYIKMVIIISIFVSMIACKYSNCEFDTIFMYVSIATQLLDTYIQFKYTHYKSNRDTNDKVTKSDKTNTYIG